jgi:transposase-like protein
MIQLKTPKSLQEAILYYSSEVVCVEFLSDLFWNGGEKCCIKCGSTAVYGLRTRPIFKCRDCKKQFSLKAGTVMHKSPLPITTWIPAIWMVVNCKNGISSCEMARALHITQKSAWHLCHRIRESIAKNLDEKLSGIVEADELHYGGIEKNRHINKRRNIGAGADKAVVFGAVERGGKVQARVIESIGAPTLQNQVLGSVKLGSTLYTDDAHAYTALGIVYDHTSVNHSRGQYVKGDAHTNSIENYWSLVKRALKGTYIHVEPFHLDRYLDEQGFRYDNRKDTDSGRFIKAAAMLFGKRLTYEELTGGHQ